MTNATRRSVLRWVHIAFGFPILGYIYGPPAEVQQYLPLYRYVFVPALVLTGVLLWKGHLLRRLVSKSPS